jgi:glycosyltransferase involved in cell wall biosynthesis
VNPTVLYISYDGILEPLGEGQVLAYLDRLAADHTIHLISFEKASDWARVGDREALRARIRSAGIRWHPLRYHKRPAAAATAYDLAAGTAAALALAVRHRVSIVHARSHVAALIAMAVKASTNARFIFDMRGFWADERVDAGLWPAGGRLYRGAKSVERLALEHADQVVTLTHAARDEIETFDYLRDRVPPIAVIPTCADLSHFRRRTPARGPFTYGFIGAATTWSLFDAVLASYRAILEIEPDARLLVVNRNEHDFISGRFAAVGIESGQAELISAKFAEMPALISRMHAAAAVRRPTYSQLGCAPTKLAEYLGCGVPCLVNHGIGDVVGIVEEDKVGVALAGLEPDQIRAGAQALVRLALEPGTGERCVAVAKRRFSLDTGVERYRAIYEELAK